jgi:ATP-dependent exoDNAse (exonuclease V) alpha subunit
LQASRAWWSAEPEDKPIRNGADSIPRAAAFGWQCARHRRAIRPAIAGHDGSTVGSYGFGELDILAPAYAATIHKSQGSEYPAVVIPVMTQHYAMAQRNLLYTGVTHGKRLVVLVGQKMTVAIAVLNVSGRRRWSKLDEWLV